MFSMYTSDNNGYFYSGLLGGTMAGVENGDWWRECMRPLSKNKKMCRWTIIADADIEFIAVELAKPAGT